MDYKRFFCLLCLQAGLVSLSAQTLLHVSLTGNDQTADGSLSNPYQTVAAAASQAADLVSNDPNTPVHILLRAGIYRNPNFSSFAVLDSNLYDPQNAGEDIWKQDNTQGSAVRLNNIHGSPNAWIVIKPYPNELPIIEADGETAFNIRNCSYIKVQGLEIRGVLDKIPKLLAWKYWGTYRYLQAAAYVYGDRKTDICNTAGISPCADIPPNVLTAHTTYTGLPNINNLNVERPNLFLGKGLLVQLSHHIDIINNNIHHFPGGGLRFTQSDFLQAIGNEIHHNSARASVGTHGLVAEGLSPISTDSSNAQKLLIANNRIYSNYNELYSWVQSKTICTVAIDEGKGLALLRTSPSISNFSGLIRVENNLAYDNGKSGLHANEVENAEFINNTVFNNAHTNRQDSAISGGTNAGISVQSCQFIKIINNLVTVPDGLNPPVQALSEGQNCSNISVSNNLVWGGASSDFVGGYLIADPLFTNLAALDVSLQPNSPAIDAGLAAVAPLQDFVFQNRDQNPDIGALEFQDPLALQLTTNGSISLYPNPFSGWLQVQTEQRGATVRVYNLIGQLQPLPAAHIQPTEAGFLLNLAHLPPASCYFIQVGQQTLPAFKH